MSEVKRFLVRLNCEYSLEVEAKSVEEALKKSEKTDLSDWTQAWSDSEAEEE